MIDRIRTPREIPNTFSFYGDFFNFFEIVILMSGSTPSITASAPSLQAIQPSSIACSTVNPVNPLLYRIKIKSSSVLRNCFQLSTFLRKRSWTWETMNLSQVIENIRELRDFKYLFVKTRQLILIDPNEIEIDPIQTELNRGRERLEKLISHIEQFICDLINPKFDSSYEITIANAKRLLEELHGKAATAALMKSVISGDAATLQFFIDNSLVNLQTDKGMTALMYAVKIGNRAIVEKLLLGKAHIDLQDKGGRTALFYTLDGKSLSLFKRLLDAHADVNVQDKEGWTVLMHAAHLRYATLVSVLISSGANKNIKSKDGFTARALADDYDPDVGQPSKTMMFLSEKEDFSYNSAFSSSLFSITVFLFFFFLLVIGYIHTRGKQLPSS